jgi:predicted hotdog family 3-hydroxylacyl-ACP dehydratase
MEFPVEDIRHLIPQKEPFLMVSTLISVDEKTAKSSFIIHHENVFVKNGVFQEAGIMENIAQTAALRAGYMALLNNNPVETGYIGAIKDFELYGLPASGDEIITEIAVENQIFNVIVIVGKVWHNSDLLARCEMKVFMNEGK